MVRIRKIEISNFRGLKSLSWCPSSGVNCIIGHGDSGKTSILDAIDFCIGARRNINFCDSDFYQLEVKNPISITVTVGDLDDSLKSLDKYGYYLRGFDASSESIEDEPKEGSETVLSVNITVNADLEPIWSLLSERATAQGLSRNLSWADRLQLSPTRIGNISDYNLSWKKGSILNKLSEESADASAALTIASRSARESFGDDAEEQLSKTLAIVKTTALELGIPTGDGVKALLDAQSISFSGGTISLHDTNGIPLSNLGVGSTRLLIAGLQRKAEGASSIILIDELEYGLEPHRIIRLLGSLGAKEEPNPMQVFMTTHSPTALKELSGDNLYILRRLHEVHNCRLVGKEDNKQGMLRYCPEAFLAASTIVCEGASEIGFIRGLDIHRTSVEKKPSIHALGVCLLDADGVDRVYSRANPLIEMGYRVSVLRDDDKKPKEEDELEFKLSGGDVFVWEEGLTIEGQIFSSVCEDSIKSILDYAISIHTQDLINEHIKTVSNGSYNLEMCRTNFSKEIRSYLAQACTTKSNGWFKTVSRMEFLAKNIIAPNLHTSTQSFQNIVKEIFNWADGNDSRS